MGQGISKRMGVAPADMASWLRRLITPPPELPSGWGYFYVGSTAAYLCGLSLQPFWATIFFSLHAPIIAAITLVMLLVFVVIIALNRRGHLLAAVCLAFAEVTIHAALLTYYIGWKGCFHFFIMDLLAVWCVAPMMRLSVRIAGALLAIGLVVYLNHAYAGAVPYYHIPEAWMTFFMAQSIGFAHIILGVAVYYYAVVNARIYKEREQLAAQLAETRRIEGVGMLAGGVAHQFNNLLAAILGNAELIGMDADARSRRLLGNIKKACGRGRALSSSLLTYSGYKGYDAGERHDLASLVRDSIDRFTAEHADCRVGLSVDDGSAGLTGYRDQFEQAVTALLNNAREATSGDEPAVIDVSMRRGRMTHDDVAELSKNFGLREGDTVACLEVADGGEGIREDAQHLIFEPFYSSRHQAGLGLSQIVGLLRMLEGGIAVVSRPDGGTRIRVCLPQ